MARQIKKGLSYFTLDCDIFSKTADLRPLLRKYKADGLGVYIHILCDVYGTGYYFKPDDYEGYLLDMAEDCGISVEKVQLILAFMADRTLLDAFSLNKNTVFTSHGIQKRYAEAMKGRKRSIAEIKGDYWLLTENEEAEINTFYKSHPSSDKSEINDINSENNGDKSEINDTTEPKGTNPKGPKQKVEIQSPLNPPSGEKAEGGDKEAFFNAYPALATFKGRYDDSAVDYSVLLERFSKSERLRKTYSMKWVCENYAAIKDGLFADKAETANHQEDRRVAWEQWNYDRRHIAEERAEKVLKRATADKVYGAIRKELADLYMQVAFAEIKDKSKAEEITKRIKELELQGDERLKKLGIDKAEFTPHYSCTCCNDTGYTQKGTICKDCFKKFEEEAR